VTAELRRIAPADQRLRVKLGEWLARIGGNVAGDLLEDGPFTRGLVVLWGPDGPVATWMGRLTQDELYRDTSSVLRELIEPEGMRPSDYREERHKAEEAEEAANPFVCRRKGGCGMRFATERGRDSHERLAERVQAAEDAIPLEGHQMGCPAIQGGTFCRCGIWPHDRRTRSDWRHQHLERPQAPPPPLQLIRAASSSQQSASEPRP
jgi:hypothetical protein